MLIKLNKHIEEKDLVTIVEKCGMEIANPLLGYFPLCLDLKYIEEWIAYYFKNDTEEDIAEQLPSYMHMTLERAVWFVKRFKPVLLNNDTVVEILEHLVNNSGDEAENSLPDDFYEITAQDLYDNLKDDIQDILNTMHDCYYWEDLLKLFGYKKIMLVRGSMDTRIENRIGNVLHSQTVTNITEKLRFAKEYVSNYKSVHISVNPSYIGWNQRIVSYNYTAYAIHESLLEDYYAIIKGALQPDVDVEQAILQKYVGKKIKVYKSATYTNFELEILGIELIFSNEVLYVHSIKSRHVNKFKTEHFTTSIPAGINLIQELDFELLMAHYTSFY